MIYRSNLTCPDLTPHFKHLWVSRGPFGHYVPHDWADKADDDPVFGTWKRCGFWTHDEAAILWNVARKLGQGKSWADVGSHTGWTTAHIIDGVMGGYTPGYCDAIDPEFNREDFSRRFLENQPCSRYSTFRMTSLQFFEMMERSRLDAFCIDANHDSPEPLNDAQRADSHLWNDGRPGVIIFHDFIGKPIQDAVMWLLDQGYEARIYCTPQMVACCWRGDFEPPEHTPDPEIVAAKLEDRMPWFPFDRVRWWK